MAKTTAETQREKREKLRREGNYKRYKVIQTQNKRKNISLKRLQLTEKERKSLKEKEKLRKRVYRAKIKSTSNEEEGGHTPLMNKFTLNRCLSRVQRSLPNNLRKRKVVVKKLAIRYTPESVKLQKQRKKSLQVSEAIREKIIKFYCKDSVSVQAPGMRDFKIVRKGTSKIKVAKRYLMLTFREAYESFKDYYPDDKIGFAKFAELRPEHVCLRSSTPENVCLCIYHENIRLILLAIPDLLNSTKEFCQAITCDSNAADCMMQKCNDCSDLKKFGNICRNFGEECLDD